MVFPRAAEPHEHRRGPACACKLTGCFKPGTPGSLHGPNTSHSKTLVTVQVGNRNSLPSTFGQFILNQRQLLRYTFKNSYFYIAKPLQPRGCRPFRKGSVNYPTITSRKLLWP